MTLSRSTALALMLLASSCSSGTSTPGQSGNARGLLSVTPTTVQFTGGSNSSASGQLVTVTEPGYTGPFIADQSACLSSGVATVAPSVAVGPTAQFNITPLAGLPCVLIIHDSFSQSVKVDISVTDTSLNLTAAKVHP